MTALTPVAANVTNKGSGAITNEESGEALSQGECVFKHTDNKWYAASSISDGDLTGRSIGICLCICDGPNERAIVAATEGDIIDLGTTVTKGTWYVVGGADGVLEEYSDLTAAENVIFVGYGNSDGHLVLAQNPSGYTK